ncbi:protein kinase [Streptomyces sp. NPDC056930]|uniref:protein kinase domain-containing protein n=1 Tax=Streptomyces sp. NPDC056930 TaxID=3345967 RepID=UPI00362F8FD2
MAPESWQPGEVILDLYEVLDVVHSGGMGVVHRVRHRGWNVDLAVKTPRPELVASAGGRRRFEAEAGTWVGLGLHPHTVNCSYVRTVDGLPRVFAEWVDGGSLAEAVTGGRLYEGGPVTALRRILDIAVQIAWGLDHAHAAGLVHQDVKPANVMLEPDGTAKVTDFGLAGMRQAGNGTPHDAPPDVTFGGMTPAYCSPEQALAATGRREIRLTPATDVWSWALTVLELFTGRRPTRHGQAAAEALEELMAGGPADARVPAVPPAVVGLLRQCFVTAPEARPAPGDLADVLADLYGDLTGTPFPRRAPQAVGLLADGLSNQALSLLDLGRAEEAEALWREAVAADPHHPTAGFNYGLYQWRKGDKTDLELVAELEAARDVGGDARLAGRLLGFVHLERDDRERAVELLREAAREEPESAEIAEALAEAERRPGLRPVVLTGHVNSVTAVAVTADGRRVLAGDYHGRVRVWAADTGRCLRELTPDGADVVATAVDAAGLTGLVVRNQAPLEVWDLTRGERVPLPDGIETASVTAVALSGDGTVGTTGHADGTLQFWNLRTGKILRRVRGHGGPVDAMSLSVDGAVALSASSDVPRDQTVRAWDVATGRCHAVLTAPPDARGQGAWGVVHYGSALSADARHALQIWAEGPMVLWDSRTSRVVAEVQHHLRHVHISALAPSGSLAVVGISGAPVRVWEPLTGRCLRTLESEDPDRADDTASARSAAVSADGRTAVLGLYEAIRVQPMPSVGYRAPWAYARPKAAGELTDHGERFRARMEQALRLARQGRFAQTADCLRAAEAVPGFERHPELRDAWRQVGRHGRRVGLRGAWSGFDLDGAGHFPDPLTLALSRNGTYFATVRLGGPIDVWNAADGRRFAEFTWDMGTASTLLLTGDDQAAVLHDNYRRNVSLLDLVGDCAYPLSSTGKAEAMAMTPAGDRVLIGESSGELRWCDLVIDRAQRTVNARGDTVRSHGHAVAAVAISADGRFAASRAHTREDVSETWYRHEDEICLWDLRSGERLWSRTERPPGLSLDFSPDGRTLLDYGAHGLWAFDTLTGRQLYSVAGTNNERVLATSADSRRGVTADYSTLTVFDLTTGRVLRSIPDAGETTALALTGEGRFAVTGVRGRQIRVWDLDTGRLLRALEGHRGKVHTLALSEDDHRVVSGDYHGTVRGWELNWDFDFTPQPSPGGEGRE